MKCALYLFVASIRDNCESISKILLIEHKTVAEVKKNGFEECQLQFSDWQEQQKQRNAFCQRRWWLDIMYAFCIHKLWNLFI